MNRSRHLTRPDRFNTATFNRRGVELMEGMPYSPTVEGTGVKATVQRMGATWPG